MRHIGKELYSKQTKLAARQKIERAEFGRKAAAGIEGGNFDLGHVLLIDASTSKNQKEEKPVAQ